MSPYDNKKSISMQAKIPYVDESEPSEEMTVGSIVPEEQQHT